ncbi:hypothetical protein [Thalassospira marina]|uniref:Phage head morphogenesis domain-containing protein n=1 Tax=Thalassospira marina TaxID=2048283 RepID=A0A2N3KSL1_9PROT|nr:hypothetical protein [Thalassospira marina]PKR53542.1 hypothetical protein COO20_13460 [Thalassospira marina]
MNDKALKSALARRQLRQAIIKADGAFDALYTQLQDAYTRAWDNQMKRALAAALDRLRDMRVDFGPDDSKRILSALETQLGPDAMKAALKGPVLNLSQAMFELGAHEVGKSVGVDILLGRADLDALDILGRGNLYWVGNSWNAYTSEVFDKALKDYFAEGLTRDQLAQRFIDDFPGVTERGSIYWNMLADHTATKTREMGRVTGYERAGVQYVQVRARLDENTTPICRAMHARIIAVSKLSQQRETYLDAVGRGDMLTAKAAWKMHSAKDAGDLEGKKTGDIPGHTASPPYHFRCRSITVVYFEPATANDRYSQKTFNREALSKKEVGELIAQAKSARWRDGRMKSHYDKHGTRYGSLEAYNTAAIDLIRRGDRDVFLSVRGNRLKMICAQPRPGKGSQLIAVVDVEKNELETFHIRSGKLASNNDDVKPVKQPGRGIIKGAIEWLLNTW